MQLVVNNDEAIYPIRRNRL